VDNGKGGISGWSCSSWEGSEEGSAVVLEKFTALTVTPNPFNPTAEIAFNLSEGGMVKLSVHDITGREVAVLSEGYESPGWHKITFTSSNLASGVYFFTLKSGDEIKTAKSLLLK
jgi:hypothetical protein